ncbi:outer membrane beta-barrel protein [Portibacter lacus]|nr:outer membrane beta-barrel protein [Portibacter lacus]
MKLSISIICLLTFSFIGFKSLQAQQLSEISGVIVDEHQKGMDLAMVSLQQLPDSTFVKSEFTDVDGSFSIVKIKAGNYILQVNIIGYEEHQQNISIDQGAIIKLPAPISLSPAVNLLGEVTITAKKPYIERKIDRTVVNVDALISNAGKDILEVLERAPGISLDNNGSILLKGRAGVAIYINDKPSNLSGTELESYLKSLPAGSVKNIEIMTNPPAKYDAAGNSGIININLKKNKLQGFNGNIISGLRQTRYTSSNNSLNLNYNKNKISLYANSSAGFFNFFQDLNINRYYKNQNNERLTSFEQNSFNFGAGKYASSNVGLDFYATEQTTIGISYRVNSNPMLRNNESTALITDSNNSLLQTVGAANETNRKFQNHVYNFYTKHLLDTIGSSITLDADYASYFSRAIQLFENTLHDNNEVLIYQDQINGEIPSQINILGAKTDYTKQFKDESKFEAGLKSAYTNTDNEAIYSTTIDNVTSPDYSLSNRFLYKEWINAAYLNYARTFGDISIQAGVRLESTKLIGEQLGNQEVAASDFTRNYTTAFPTFYSTYKLDSLSNNVLTFSYGRRIDRPYFQDLNPFISPLDKFTFYSGNPNLLPTYSHNFSLSHSWKSYITTTLNYSKTIDGIQETLEIRDGIYYSRPGNIASNQSMTLSLEGSIPVTKWYNLNTYLSMSYVNFESQLYTEQLNSSGINYYLSATNSFTFGKGWSGEISGNYSSDVVYAQLLLKSWGQMNFGIRKKILNDKGSIRFAVNDIFYTRRGSGVINNLRLTDANWDSKYDSRVASLTFAWRFGKSTLKKQKYNSKGSSEEQNRVQG